MKTRDQIITRSLRKLGVVSEDEDASGAMLANSGDALDGILWEVRSSAFAFAYTTVFPEDVANALTDLLAAELAPEYKPAQPPYSRATAFARLMAIVRPDDRFVNEYTGSWGIEQIDSTTYGYEQTAVKGMLVPMMPGVREIAAKSDLGIVRLRPYGRSKINGLDRLQIRLSSWQADTTILTWDNVNREYSLADADLAAWIVGRVGLSTQLTISDPDVEYETQGRAAYY
jgi:hypothetical protein